MAPQLQGYYAVSSWPRLTHLPPWPCASHAQRRRVLRLLPPPPPRRRLASAVRVVAEAAGPALALDRVAGLEGGVRFSGDVEGVPDLQQRRREQQQQEEEAVDERERLRRMRISKANKGNTPWNKGRKHSPETLQRIRERTRIAMQDPKVKKKLMNLGHAQSEETRIKISMGVRRGWNLRLQKLMIQDGCFVEWRDIIADAARKGFAGGISLQWNSYKILTEQMRQEWLEKIQKRRSMPRPTGNRRAPKSPEQRRKIAEAIAAKWLDQEYRERVCSGIASYHGSSSGTKVPRKPRSPREPGVKRETTKKKPHQSRLARLEDAHGTTPTVKRKKSATPYKDPMAGEKLEMITKIRAQRAALEVEKKEAIKRARSLIAEAEKAANALESVAATSPFAQASLIEARKLVTEARLSLERVDDESPSDSASDDTSQDSSVPALPNYGIENQNDVIKQESKPVNGMELPASNVNGMDFYFDVSTLSETEHLRDYERIENSMERAYLLPSASSSLQDVNGNHRMKDFNAHPLITDQSTAPDQITSEATENCPDQTQEDATLPVQQSKMRWVRGRLVEVEE
uniref:Nuclease associated modular domain-containing protein n=1 Tax=Leersia perrieri TaxID=77586 RepID=A0A0D9XIE7_9ORYZ